MTQTEKPKKVVRVIPATPTPKVQKQSAHKKVRVAAYCRVSTKQEEQLNSYAVQKRTYTERINNEPDWTLVDIFADKGITGTSTKKRDEFNRMIRMCKRGKIDLIITKSISRFARNTVDCLKYVRMLRELGIDVYFEEQHLHSINPSSEFYITIFGSIAQSESENISANVKWGKAQSAKEGKVPFHYTNFLGYRKGADGEPEIDPEEAKIIRLIYTRYLAGDSLAGIARRLEEQGARSPMGRETWSVATIRSILLNEKYKGDAILNKTYSVDCLSKKIRVNKGERPKYYVENNHPAIIDAATFGRVQEEFARRTSKRKVKEVGTKTELGRYSSRYALTELLICGECGTPYRRCTWTATGEKIIVWRCIKRLDYGKRYCHNSPSMKEDLLHEAIMEAIQKVAMQDTNVLHTLKLNIGMGLAGESSEDHSIDIQVRISEIDVEVKKMLQAISADMGDDFDEDRVTELMQEKHQLEAKLAQFKRETQWKELANSRVDEICMITDTLKNHPMIYDDQMVRQIISRVVVVSKDRIRVTFVGGLEIEQTI